MALGKSDTCYDIKHKKRGRPRLRDKQSGNKSDYEVMCGTIHTPTFATESTTATTATTVTMTTAQQHHHPSSSPATAVHQTTTSSQQQQRTIQPAEPIIIQETVEAFQALPPATTSSPSTAASSMLQSTNNDNPTHEFLHHPLDLDGLQFPFDELTFSGDAMMQNYMLPFDDMLPLDGATSAYASLPATNHHNATFHADHHPQGVPDQHQQGHPTSMDTCMDGMVTTSSPMPATTTTSNTHNNKVSLDDQNPTMATLVLSMDVCCARVSEQVTEMWGYYPQELAHRSLYDFVSSKDTDRLSKLHRLLLDNVLETGRQRILPTTQRTTSDLFHTTTFKQLATVASGASTFTDTLRIKKRCGSEDEVFEIAISVGGGLGADLAQPSTLPKLYILAQLRKSSNIPRASSSSPTLPRNRTLTTSSSSSSSSSSSPSSPSKSSFSNHRPKTPPTRFSPSPPRIRLGSQSYMPSSPPKVNIAPTRGLDIRPTFNQPSSSASLICPSPTLRTTPATAVNHPTTQYFLQTSSSMLNAAASAAQSRNRCMSQPLVTHMAANNDKAIGAVENNRTLEMSIRSLLC